ncbi:hypothetical protein K7472_19960 [Streptomyces sp. PTM05]|uniref:Glycine zipper domain-containing protein n=1 Tax=Streptantibioticus parmotrematis TaxID=2873249 RepID=A0ABS7QV82_9ACTN|nr:hypothetical protein [Streptantibioticus parmotrematis]MBY8887105.1 hypothetical protein [Streptantibioticus parmotrematis]
MDKRIRTLFFLWSFSGILAGAVLGAASEGVFGALVGAVLGFAAASAVVLYWGEHGGARHRRRTPAHRPHLN